MITITLGLLLWSLVHFLPSVGAPLKTRMVVTMGESAYKGIFSLLLITAIVLMVMGWKQTIPTHLYSLPTSTQPLALLLMLSGFICLAAASLPAKIKRLIRHPQLTGVLLWASAHLILNGDSRSLLLFGGLGLWALLEIIFISRREGAWVKAENTSWSKTALAVVIGGLIFSLLAYLHPYLTGVAVV